MVTNPVQRTGLERTLPRTAYLSDEHYRLESERIFYREWFLVGREESLPQASDAVVVEIAGESIIVTRTRAGDLRAHYNVCRHRGSRLALADPTPVSCAFPGPNTRFKGVIQCGYHSWCYELDGALRNAPYLDEKKQFYDDEFSLYPVSLETWGGFIFLNLTPDETRGSLMDQLGAIPDRIQRYPLADLRTARRLVYDVDANWKVMVENYNECYHCAGVHPELCKIVPAFKQGGGASLEWEDGIPQADGTFTFTLSGTTNRAAFPGLSPEEQVRHKGEMVYPNLMLSLSAEHIAAFMLLPRGPGHTTIVVDFLFHPSEIEKPDFDPSDAVDFWDLVNKQDWAVCEAVQKGMNSRVFEYGYYAPMEDLSLDIRRYLHEKLGNGAE